MIILRDGNLSAIVIAEDGMNVVSLRYRGEELVDFDGGRRASGQCYSIPVTFPTPGRIRGGEFEFEGRRIPAMMHGFVRTRSFRVIERTPSSVKGRLSFHGGDEMFPFTAEFVVGISLEEDSILWQFDLWNRDECNIPYGIALHPFFSKTYANGNITANVAYRLEWDEHKMADGVLIPASGLFYDMNKGYRIRSIASDGQYMTDVPMKVLVEFDSFRMSMECDDEFRFLGIYASPDHTFFCADPSTCSYGFTDLYSRGMKKESGLLVLPPGKEKILSVRFRFSDADRIIAPIS